VVLLLTSKAIGLELNVKFEIPAFRERLEGHPNKMVAVIISVGQSATARPASLSVDKILRKDVAL